MRRYMWLLIIGGIALCPLVTGCDRGGPHATVNNTAFESAFRQVIRQARGARINAHDIGKLHAFLDPQDLQSLTVQEQAALEERVEKVANAIVDTGNIQWLVEFQKLRFDTCHSVSRLIANWAFVGRYPDRFFRSPNVNTVSFSEMLSDPCLAFDSKKDMQKCLDAIEKFFRQTSDQHTRQKAHMWAREIRKALPEPEK